MMVSGRVSAIIPTYQRARVVGRAIDSALAQAYPDVEILVIDDGSSDDTAQVVQGYGSKVHYIYQDNQGRSAARNRGIRHATGEFVAILDSDDWWHPLKLEKQVACMQKYRDVGMVYSRSYIAGTAGKTAVFGQGPEAPDDIFDRLLTENLVPTSSALIRRRCLDEVGGFNEKMDFAEDWEMWLRLAATDKMMCIPEPLSYYRMEYPEAVRYPDLRKFLSSRMAAVRNGCRARMLVRPVPADLEAYALAVSCLYAAFLAFALERNDRATSYLARAIATDLNMFNRHRTWYFFQNYARYEAAGLGTFDRPTELLKVVLPVFGRLQPGEHVEHFPQRAEWLLDQARASAAWLDWGAALCYLEMARQLDPRLSTRRLLVARLCLLYVQAALRKATRLLGRRVVSAYESARGIVSGLTRRSPRGPMP